MIHSADRIALGEAKRVFTNSKNVQQRLWSSLRLPAEPLYHHSPISEMLMKVDAGPHGDEIVFPSRFESLKRQSLAVEAMRHVRTDVRLVLVGKGQQEDALQRQILDHNLEDRVSIEVWPSDERLEQLLLGALGVYYGPFDEDYGYVTIEGFAARRPMVTLSDSGGPLEFVLDGETGLVAPPEPEAIAEAFDHLYADRVLAARLGAAGRALIEREVPSWPEVVARLLA
jgi:glycosyltransferase involved in cell wall biosynthesis